jgi:hypothetical protein
MGKHPWKAEVTESGAGVSSSTVTGWFTEVYERSTRRNRKEDAEWITREAPSSTSAARNMSSF